MKNSADYQTQDISRFISMPLLELVQLADQVRQKFCGPSLDICSIINAKSGVCNQDCTFCAQSGHYHTGISSYPLLSDNQIADAALKAETIGAKRFGIVTSGHSIDAHELQQLCRVIAKIKSETRLEVCGSFGILSKEDLSLLHQAGLSRFHHNIETSPSFYGKICTTHDFQDRVKTIDYAKQAGLEICSDVILGLGESWNDRMEMILTLKELDVNSVPLNILIPIPGTPLESSPSLSPFEIIRAIAIFRIILEKPVIKIAAGRDTVFKDFQGLGFMAGANGMIRGGYLTTKGRDGEDDQKLIRDILSSWQEPIELSS
ncbi:MAG TPA: biotin synthase BioB [Bacillota bacterium]|nr:biotin synthase BioB [Bacillota bacterium]